MREFGLTGRIILGLVSAKDGARMGFFCGVNGGGASRRAPPRGRLCAPLFE